MATVSENLTTTVEGVYEPTGTLTVTTTPVAGEVFVNDISWGLAPQSRVVQIGTYNVSFGPVADYITPAWQLAIVYENLTTTVTGVYELIVHDVAVTNIGTTSYEVDINDPTQLTVTINVTVTNEGDLTETFDVIIRYDTTDIATKTVTNLPAGNSTIVNFDWDVTGLALGTYTIEAEAILADDADLINNKKTSDWTIEIVPEFPTLIPLLLALAILAVSTIVLKRKPLTKPSTSGSPTTQP